jgi:hypothetical protein|tara:strand:- start:307 stop:537 length:231 start_codon:yes stop_codon:yes gene_type:complete
VLNDLCTGGGEVMMKTTHITMTGPHAGFPYCGSDDDRTCFTGIHLPYLKAAELDEFVEKYITCENCRQEYFDMDLL